METHACRDCTPFHVVFQPLLTQPRKTTGKPTTTTARPAERPIEEDVAYVRNPPLLQHHYPPPPLSVQNKASIITEFASSMQPVQFEEAGCAVCGQLTPLTDLTDLGAADCCLDPT